MNAAPADPNAKQPEVEKADGIHAAARPAVVPSCPACGREMCCEEGAARTADRVGTLPWSGRRRYYCAQCNAWLTVAC